MNRAALISIALLVAVAGGISFWYADDRTAGERDDAAVRSVVEAFGKKLASVSLLAPADTVAMTMEEHYKDFVTPDLLAAWQRNPTAAPGRLTSSPWPDRIEISALEYTAPGTYTMRGEIVEITSADITSDERAVRRPVTLTVENQNGRWVITGLTMDTALPEGWRVFSQEGIQFAYPPKFTARAGSDLGGGFITPTIARADGSAEAFGEEKTNFINAAFVIAASSQAASSCLAFTDLPQPPPDDAVLEGTINGVPFRMYRTVGAAAGNRYDSELFRTVRGGTCYEIALVVHTGAIANYQPGTVQEFDARRAFDVLERILDSLRFLSAE